MIKLGVIAALPTEARCLTGRSVPTRQIIQIKETSLIISGIGDRNAANAAERLISTGINALVSWGTAGALCPELRPGMVFIPETVQHPSTQQYHTQSAWRQQMMQRLAKKIPAKTGSIVQSDSILTGKQHKSDLHHSSQAQAVDMESGAIAAIAHHHKLPFLIIRSIADAHDQSVPSIAIDNIDEYGRVLLRTFLPTLIRKPGEIADLLRLGINFRRACNSLRQVTMLAGTTLAVPGKFSD